MSVGSVTRRRRTRVLTGALAAVGLLWAAGVEAAPTPVATNRTLTSYDAYGRPEVVTVQSGPGGVVQTVTETRTTYGGPSLNGLIASLPTQVTVRDGSGRVVQDTFTTYDGQGRPVQNLVWRDRPEEAWVAAATTTYDAFGNPVAVTDARGGTTVTTYLDDPSSPFYMSLPSSVTNPLGHTGRIVYDGYGRVAQRRGVDHDSFPEDSETLVYDALHRPVATYRGTQDTPRVRVSYPSFTQTWTETIREDGTYNRSLARMDALGREKEIATEYDDGTTIRWLKSCKHYDAQGRPWWVTEPTFVEGPDSPCGPASTVTEYDTLDRVVRTAYGDGRPAISVFYNGLSRTTRKGDDPNYDVTTTLDSRGLVASRTEPGSATIEYEHDALGRLVRVQVTGGAETVIEYDSLGRKVSIFDGNQTPRGSLTMRYAYDAAGDLVQTVDAGGQVIHREYDLLGRPTRRCVGGGGCSDPDSLVEVIAYDTAPGAASGKLHWHATPATPYESATRMSYEYDAKGRLETTALTIDGATFAGHLRYNDYTDAPNCAVLPDGSAVRNAYTASGKNLERVEYKGPAARGDCHFADPDNTFRYSDYSEKGRVGTVEYLAGGRVVNTARYSYTPWGGLSTAGTVGQSGTPLEALEYRYTPLLEINAVLDNVQAAGGTTLYQDYLGNHIDGDRTQAYRYDFQGRLVQAVSGAGASCSDGPGGGCSRGATAPDTVDGTWDYSYAFDPTGNLINKEGVDFTYDEEKPQQLLTFGPGRYTYDASGNVITKETPGESWRYTYNAGNMLVQAERSVNGGPWVVVERNTYRGESRLKKDYLPGRPDHRVQTYYVGGGFEARVKADGTRLHTVYVQGPAGKLASFTTEFPPEVGAGPSALVVKPSVGAPGRRPSRRREPPDSKYEGLERAGSGQILAIIGDDTMSGPPQGGYFYFANHIGSNSIVTYAEGERAGEVATLMNYTPYGKINQDKSSGSDTTTRKFTGQEYDGETLLYNFGARMYDLETGRFLTADTVVPGGGRDSQGLNRYMHTRGNPVTLTDPTGHTYRNCGPDNIYCGGLPDDPGTQNWRRPPPPPPPAPPSNGGGNGPIPDQGVDNTPAPLAGGGALDPGLPVPGGCGCGVVRPPTDVITTITFPGLGSALAAGVWTSAGATASTTLPEGFGYGGQVIIPNPGTVIYAGYRTKAKATWGGALHETLEFDATNVVGKVVKGVEVQGGISPQTELPYGRVKVTSPLGTYSQYEAGVSRTDIFGLPTPYHEGAFGMEAARAGGFVDTTVEAKFASEFYVRQQWNADAAAIAVTVGVVVVGAAIVGPPIWAGLTGIVAGGGTAALGLAAR